MADVVTGRDVRIYSGTSGTTPLVAGAKSCTVTRKADLLGKASASTGRDKEFVAGQTEWEVSMNHLVLPANPFAGLLMVGQTYTLRVKIGSATVTGTAICIQADLSAPVGGLATGSVKLKGTGALG